MSENSSHNKTTKKYGKISFWIAAIFYSLIGIVSIVLLLFSLRTANVKQEKFYKDITTKNALWEFNAKTKVDAKWFSNKYTMPDSILAISIDKKALILKRGDIVDTICHYSNGANNHIKLVKGDENFYALFKEGFGAKISDFDTVTPDSLISFLNARSDYSNEVSKDKGLSTKDRVFSLIYNKIVGGQKGHVAVVIKNKKLKTLTVGDMRTAQIDLAQLAESMKYVYEKDTLSEQGKYVVACYQEKFARKRNTDENSAKDTLYKKLVTFLDNENAVSFNKKLPFDFIYLNFRGDKMYIGDKEYQLPISDKETKDIYDKIMQNPEKIYYKFQGKTFELPVLPENDSLKWGTVNRTLLEKAQFTNSDVAKHYVLVPLKSKTFVLGAVILVSLLIIIGCFALWLLYKTKTAAIVSKDVFDTVQGKDIDEKIENLIRKYDAYCKMKNAEKVLDRFLEYKKLKPFIDIKDKTDIDKILETFDNIFGTENIETLKEEIAQIKKSVQIATIKAILKDICEKDIAENELETTISNIKRKRQFYDCLYKNKDKTSKFIELLEKEFEITIDFNPTLKEWFKRIKEEAQAEANETNQNVNDLIIEYILADLDEKLRRIFIKYMENLYEYKKCNSLLAENIQTKSFLKYLEEKIETLAETLDIEKFIVFGLLFNPKSHKKINKKEDILQQYSKTKALVEKFETIYSSNQSIKSQTLKQLSLGLSAVYDLAFPLLKTWRKAQNWTEKNLNDFAKSYKEEMLYSIETVFFVIAYDENKMLEFNKEKAELHGLITDYNSKNSTHKLEINNEYWNTLTQWAEKIIKSDDNTIFVENMYKFFVADFLKKVRNIKSNSPQDRIWFLEELFNITFHAADYVDYAKNGKSLIYCENYSLLRDDLDFAKQSPYEFEHNHYAKSTAYSNAIYELAKELNINNLKILVEKYQIKL